MIKKIEEIVGKTLETGITRRTLLAGACKFTTGALLISAAGATAFADTKSDKRSGDCIESPVITESGAQYPWPYVKLNPQKTAEIAYENWYKGFCAYAVTTAILGQLQEKVGDPYKSMPIEAFSFGHGGTVGWGTLCGTLFGSGISASFAAGKTGEQITNDMLAWYSETELPTFKPKQPKGTILSMTTSNSPLCHVSVGRWMAKEGVEFASPQRKDRCARLAANVAAKTVELLNAAADGVYKPVHGSQTKAHGMTAQNNCTACHGG